MRGETWLDSSSEPHKPFLRTEPFQDTHLKGTNDVAVGGSHKREKKKSTKPHRLPWRSGRLETSTNQRRSVGSGPQAWSTGGAAK